MVALSNRHRLRYLARQITGGAFNYEAFRSIVEQYYRSLVGAGAGAGGSGIRISGGSNIRMRNNTFIQPATAEFEVQVTGGPW